MKSIFTLSFILYFSLLGISQEKISSQEVKQKVMEVSKRDLVSFLNNIPDGFEKQHGFNSRSEFSAATPSSIYTIMGVNAAGKTFKTNNFNVAVSVNGEYRAVITVSSENGNYAIETVGASLMAKELQVIENNQDSENSEKIMLNFYEDKCGFVAFEKNISNIEAAAYTPLASAITVLGETKTPIKTTYELTELINILSNN